jgi:PmbA protein
MIPKKELSTLTHTAVKAALQAGADQAEAYEDLSRQIVISVSGKHIHSVRVTYDSGVGIRSYVKGCLGFSYTMQLNEKAIKDTAEKATKLAMVSQRDPHFKSLPEPTNPKLVKGLYDRELASITVEETSKIVENMIRVAHEVSKDAVLRGNLYAVSRNYAITNSLGINFEESVTSISTYMMSIVKKTFENVGSGMEFDYSRSLKDFNPEWVSSQATSKALKFLGAQQSKTRACTLLLSPNATWRLSYALAFPLDGQSIALDRSCLAGRVGTRIASEKFTLIDDGSAEKGFSSSSVDAEGVPKEKFAIIEDGVLKTYLHNSYTAGRLGMKNNACAARDSYKSTLATAPSNLQIKPGDQKLDEMISDVKDGIYLDSFPFPDPVTGNISSMIDFGIQIRNGAMTEPIKGTMIGSNLLEILHNIDSISKEVRSTAGISMPYLTIKNIQIAGK